MFSAIIEIPSTNKDAAISSAKQDGMIVGGAVGVILGLLVGVVLAKLLKV